MVSALSRVSHRLLSGLFLTLPLVGPPLARYRGQYLGQGYALGYLSWGRDGQVSVKVADIAWPFFLVCKGGLWLYVFFSLSFYFLYTRLPELEPDTFSLSHTLGRNKVRF